MKKILLPIIATLLLFSGCREKAHVMTSYYTVEHNQWRTYPSNSTSPDYIYSAWDNIDITPDIIDAGVVLAYYIDEDGRDNLLPYTIYHMDDNGVPYQERIEYDVEFDNMRGCGVITFKIKDTDFNILDSYANLGTSVFKVCVIGNY